MTVLNGPMAMPATRDLIRRMLGIVPSVNTPSIPQTLLEAGFQQVVATVEWLPLGPWMDDERGKAIGGMAVDSMVRLVKALRPALLDRPNASEQEVDALLAQAEQEIRTSSSAGISIPYHLVHATRP